MLRLAKHYGLAGSAQIIENVAGFSFWRSNHTTLPPVVLFLFFFGVIAKRLIDVVRADVGAT